MSNFDPITINTEEVLNILADNLSLAHRKNKDVMKFIECYLLHYSAEQAAKEAGISTGLGRSLLKRPDISRAITKVIESDQIKFGYTTTEVVERVKELANSDIGDCIDPTTGAFIENLHDWPPHLRRAIKKVEIENIWSKDENDVKFVSGKVLKVQFYDKEGPLTTLGQEKDVFVKKTHNTNEIGATTAATLIESMRLAREASLGIAHTQPAIDVTPTLDVPPTNRFTIGSKE